MAVVGLYVALSLIHAQAAFGFVLSPHAERFCRHANAPFHVLHKCEQETYSVGRRQSYLNAVSGSETVEDDDSSFDVVEDMDEEEAEVQVKLDAMERAWRYAKKPLLSIGSKGATLTHGNSLRQLLDQHTVVKVKVNTRRFDNSLQEAFVQLRALAEENGAPAGIELLQARDSEKIILFGLPGTLQRIKDNEFPLSP